LLSSSSAGLSDCLIRSSTKAIAIPVGADASRIKQTRSTLSKRIVYRDHHPAIEFIPRLVHARRIDEDDLAFGRLTMPRILKRVVCGLFETARFFSPTSRLSKCRLARIGSADEGERDRHGRPRKNDLLVFESSDHFSFQIKMNAFAWERGRLVRTGAEREIGGGGLSH